MVPAWTLIPTVFVGVIIGIILVALTTANKD